MAPHQNVTPLASLHSQPSSTSPPELPVQTPGPPELLEPALLNEAASEPPAEEDDDFDNATIPEVTADDRAAEASIRGASSPAAPVPVGYDEAESIGTLESSTHENGRLIRSIITF